MNNTIKIGLFVIALFAVPYLISAVFTKRAVENLDNPNAAPAISESRARSEFMTGCHSAEIEGSYDYCQCLYDEMRESYTVNQMASDGLNLSQEEMEAKYDREITFCLNYVWGDVL